MGERASDAFKILSNETRLDILRALFETGSSGQVTPSARSFSELYEATDEETTAGFAYHLRQLVGQFLEKDEETETYRLTYAGLQVARGVTAGTYTESVTRDPVALEEPCPFCADSGLELRVTDNVTTVTCDACGHDVLSLPFPPGGFRSHDDASLPTAFDRQHRHRIGLMTDGNCPECAGVVKTRLEPVDEGTVDEAGETPVRARLDCETCGYTLRCPVTLTVLEEPSVVAFYHEQGVDLDDRPIWNVGTEWAERVISADPLAVRVSTELDDEVLSLFLAGDGSVVHQDRYRSDSKEASTRDRSRVESTRSESSDADAEAETEADSDSVTA